MVTSFQEGPFQEKLPLSQGVSLKTGSVSTLPYSAVQVVTAHPDSRGGDHRLPFSMEKAQTIYGHL